MGGTFPEVCPLPPVLGLISFKGVLVILAKMAKNAANPAVSYSSDCPLGGDLPTWGLPASPRIWLSDCLHRQSVGPAAPSEDRRGLTSQKVAVLAGRRECDLLRAHARTARKLAVRATAFSFGMPVVSRARARVLVQELAITIA